ncbi:MAG: hypothetical protein ACKOSQ_09170, partial [Planctomycetaceae bacterium]
MTPPGRDAGSGGPRRSLPALAAALARAWWPQVAALAAAAAVVAATITGALGVGSALRRGLRDLALERLGRIEAAVVAEDFVRADAAAELAAGLDGTAEAIVPAIVADVIVEAAAATPRERRAVRSVLLACDDPAALGYAGVAGSAAGDVSVNAPLAAALGVRVGEPIVVRTPPRSAVPADSPLGRRSGLATGSRLAVARVLPEEGLGRFSLAPAAATRPLVVVPLAVAQRLFGRAGAATALFAVARRSSEVATSGAATSGADAVAMLRAGFRPQLADLGLALEPVAGGRALRLTSRRLILPPAVDRAAAAILAPLGARPTLAFLA